MGAQAHPLVADDAIGPRALGAPRASRVRLARVGAVLERETFVVVALATAATLLLANLANAIGGDTWLLLLSGREIAADGLPQSDSLTIWGAGREWVDQQWAAQLVFHAVASVGGLKAALLLNVAVFVGALAVAFAGARALGAPAGAVAASGLGCLVVAFPHSGLRAQTLAYPLFAATLFLLARAGRAPSRSVLLVLPLLVVWANVHGSVLLGAGLVSLFAVVESANRRAPQWSWRILAVLAVAPWLCVLASPYGLGLVQYYRDTVGNAQFFALIGEWGPSSVPAQAPFFALAGAAVWLVARSRGRLTPFEVLVLFLTLAAGLAAIRNIVWFALAAAALLPLCLGEPVSRKRRVRANLALVAGAMAIVVASALAVTLRPDGAYLRGYPNAAADAVARAAAADRSVRVFSNEQFADWLLWREPGLAGRVAFDTRFELLSSRRLRSIATWRGRAGDDWRAAARGFDVIVLDPRSEREIERALLRDEGTRVLLRDRAVVVLRREGRR